MGCMSSSTSGGGETRVSSDRRRLSVSGVDKKGEESGQDVSEDDRGLIATLDEKDVTEMLSQGDRKMSIGSTQDSGKTSFANKSVKSYGEELDTTANCLGYTCRKGLKPESPNQDSWCVLKVDDSFSMYAVFDGHGQKGHEVSNFVKENLPKLVIKDSRFKTNDMPAMLMDCFKKMQSLVATADRMKKLSAQMSGTTATLVLHDHEQKKLTVSHVADSSAVLGKFKKGEKRDTKDMEAQQLTRDHKPNLKDERARIEKNGGRVVFDGYANHRIYAKSARYPGLNMSRCMGDLMGHADCGITAEPEVKEMQIQPEDHVLLVCSDGVWEFISPEEAVKLVAEFKPAKAMQAAEKLAKEAWDRWITEEGGAVVDDITVVLVYLNQNNQDSNAP